MISRVCVLSFVGFFFLVIVRSCGFISRFVLFYFLCFVLFCDFSLLVMRQWKVCGRLSLTVHQVFLFLSVVGWVGGWVGG